MKQSKAYNPYWHKHKVIYPKFFYAPEGVCKTMTEIYEACKDFLIPFMQNDLVTPDGKHHHLYTSGRYDINSSNTWDMTPEQKRLAQETYKGKRCYEWPFYIHDIHIAVVVSKSGATATLVVEDDIDFPGFTRVPGKDAYLTDKWLKPQEIINQLKVMSHETISQGRK